MAGTTTPQRDASDARRAWVAGGVLIIVSAVFAVVIVPGMVAIPQSGLIGVVLFAAALLCFAFGIRGSGSVTARRPLGTTALAVLAGWMLLAAALNVVAAGIGVDALGWMRPFGSVDVVVRFILALIAAIQIARAAVVPRPWNWAPCWALAAVTATWIIETIALTLSANAGGPATQSMLVSLDELVHLGAPIFLGVLAIVLASRIGRSRTVVIYSSRTEDDEE